VRSTTFLTPRRAGERALEMLAYEEAAAFFARTLEE
jgi:hypothetical protein